MMELEIKSCGDSAAMVTLKNTHVEAAWKASHKLARTLINAKNTPVIDVGPTFNTLLIEYDPLKCSFSTLKLLILLSSETISESDVSNNRGRIFRVPVLYGGENGPDMDNVAKHTGLNQAEIIQEHTKSPLLIRCFGAPSGSPLSDGPNMKWDVPRQKSPRTKIPAGSVALAGRQSLIYSTSAPGGWQLIGRTPLSLVDVKASRPVLYNPGDSIHYYSITKEEFRSLLGKRLSDEHRVH